MHASFVTYVDIVVLCDTILKSCAISTRVNWLLVGTPANPADCSRFEQINLEMGMLLEVKGYDQSSDILVGPFITCA